MHLNRHNYRHSNHRISYIPARIAGGHNADTIRHSPVLSQRELQREVLDILG